MPLRNHIYPGILKEKIYDSLVGLFLLWFLGDDDDGGDDEDDDDEVVVGEEFLI